MSSGQKAVVRPRGRGALRNPEYDVRDRRFKAFCDTCKRAKRCTFREESDGPETVCLHLIMDGTYNCESCLRYNTYDGCDLHCCFYTPVSGTIVANQKPKAPRRGRSGRKAKQ